MCHTVSRQVADGASRDGAGPSPNRPRTRYEIFVFERYSFSSHQSSPTVGSRYAISARSTIIRCHGRLSMARRRRDQSVKTEETARGRVQGRAGSRLGSRALEEDFNAQRVLADCIDIEQWRGHVGQDAQHRPLRVPQERCAHEKLENEPTVPRAIRITVPRTVRKRGRAGQSGWRGRQQSESR